MKIITLTDKEYLILNTIVETYDKNKTVSLAALPTYQSMPKQLRTPVYDDQKD